MGYALDLLKNKNEEEISIVTRYYNPVLMGIGGFGMCAFANFLQRRPLLAGKSCKQK